MFDKIQRGFRMLRLFNTLKKPFPKIKNRLGNSLEDLSVTMNKQRRTLDEQGNVIGPDVHNYQKFGKDDFEARQNFRKSYYFRHPEELLSDFEIIQGGKIPLKNKKASGGKVKHYVR